jgi:ribonuclease P protein component
VENKLRKKEILRGWNSFAKVIRRGKCIQGILLRCYLQISPCDKNSSQHRRICFGFSVPQKRVTLSVDRNRIRRRMKEVYRCNKESIFLHAEKNNCSVEAVLLFANDQKKDVRRITVEDLQKDWYSMSKLILAAMEKPA